jgi:hypothetical protein
MHACRDCAHDIALKHPAVTTMAVAAIRARDITMAAAAAQAPAMMTAPAALVNPATSPARYPPTSHAMRGMASK